MFVVFSPKDLATYKHVLPYYFPGPPYDEESDAALEAAATAAETTSDPADAGPPSSDPFFDLNRVLTAEPSQTTPSGSRTEEEQANSRSITPVKRERSVTPILPVTEEVVPKTEEPLSEAGSTDIGHEMETPSAPATDTVELAPAIKHEEGAIGGETEDGIKTESAIHKTGSVIESTGEVKEEVKSESGRSEDGDWVKVEKDDEKVKVGDEGNIKSEEEDDKARVKRDSADRVQQDTSSSHSKQDTAESTVSEEDREWVLSSSQSVPDEPEAVKGESVIKVNVNKGGADMQEDEDDTKQKKKDDKGKPNKG